MLTQAVVAATSKLQLSPKAPTESCAAQHTRMVHDLYNESLLELKGNASM